MILRRLRSFATVAAEGGISRAAARLHVAQPALSRQIRDLEQTVGVSLFERDRRGVQLTRAGLRLQEDAERVFARLDETLCRVFLAHDGRLGTLRLGLSRGALNNRRVGDILVAFRAQFEDVELVVREVEVWSQAQALKSHDVDATIGLGDETDRALFSATLFEEFVDSAVFATSHRLAVPGPIEPGELIGEPLRLDSVSMPRFRGLRQALERLGFEWEELEGLDTVYGYVAAGNGWLPGFSSTNVDRQAGFVVRPMPGLHVPIPMALRWTRNDIPVLRNFTMLATGAPAPVVESNGDAHTEIVRTPSIEESQLAALVSSLNGGSLSAAAEVLGLTQSAISRQIRSLEKSVGVPLIARTGGRLTGTAAGNVLRDEAPAVLELIDHALERARRTVDSTRRRCAIGTMARELTNGVLVDALKQLTESHPELTITVEEGRFSDALESGDVDLVLTSVFPGDAEEPALDSMLLHDDPLVCALIAESHPLAKHATLSPSDLAKEPFLFVSRAFATPAYDLIIGQLRQLGLGASLGAEYNGARAIWRAVASGAGWALGTRSLYDASLPGIVARPIEGLHIPWGIGLKWRRDETDPVIMQVADIIRARARAPEDAMAH